MSRRKTSRNKLPLNELKLLPQHPRLTENEEMRSELHETRSKKSRRNVIVNASLKQIQKPRKKNLHRASGPHPCL